MVINDNYKDEILIEGEVYEYKNHIATYHIRFRAESNIFSRCCVLCSKKDFLPQVLSALDKCDIPQYLDNLDLKVNLFDTTEVFNTKIHFMTSYTVEVELVSLNNAEQ